VQIQSGGAFIDSNGFNIGITTALQGSGGLNKQGACKLTLSAASTYAGLTTVETGTLEVTGSLSGATTVQNGATLSGTGVVGAVMVNIGGVLQGGDGVTASGALSSGGAVSLLDGSMIRLTLGPSATHSSLLRTGEVWSFDSDQAFAFTVALGASGTTTYDNIISGLTGSETGLGSIGSWVITTPGMSGSFVYDNAGGVDLLVMTIPEPGTGGLLLGGLFVSSLRRVRRPGTRRAMTGDVCPGAR